MRPFGITAIVGGWDSEAETPVDAQVGVGPKTGAGGKITAEEDDLKRGGPGLYMIEPSGQYWVLRLSHIKCVNRGLIRFHRAIMGQQRAREDNRLRLSSRSSTSPLRHVL